MLECGQQYGIIRFGSRVDVWLPNPVFMKVLIGQRTYAGETILADFETASPIGKVRVQ
jgi:phosphatidylserine decarboxylase